MSHAIAVSDRFPFFVATLLLSASPAAASTCIVVSVSDGDTLTVFCDGKQLTVDVAEIDAPELGQPFGNHARQSLSDMCYRRTARLIAQRTDNSGRLVARVRCDGVSAAAEQLRRGMAWVSEEHASDQTLYVAQDIARHAGRGLWAGEAPMAPWEWRRVAAAEAEVKAKPKVVRRVAAPPPEPENPVAGFFRRLFGQ